MSWIQAQQVICKKAKIHKQIPQLDISKDFRMESTYVSFCRCLFFFFNLGVMNTIIDLVYQFLLLFRLFIVLDKFVLFDPASLSIRLMLNDISGQFGSFCCWQEHSALVILILFTYWLRCILLDAFSNAGQVKLSKSS